jgi:hypothetical protein
VEVIKVLGTPSKDEIRELNPNYVRFDFPIIDPIPLASCFKSDTSADAIDLIANLFRYRPSARIHPMRACGHPFFNKLRMPGTRMPNGRQLPPLFNFDSAEIKIQQELQVQVFPAPAMAATPKPKSSTQQQEKRTLSERRDFEEGDGISLRPIYESLNDLKKS